MRGEFWIKYRDILGGMWVGGLVKLAQLVELQERGVRMILETEMFSVGNAMYVESVYLWA